MTFPAPFPSYVPRVHSLFRLGARLIALACLATALSAQSMKPKPHVPLKGSGAAAKYVVAGEYFRAKEWDKAVVGYLAAVEMDPQFAGALLLAGDARYEQKRDAEAAAFFARASQLDPRMEKAHEHHALALTRLGRIDEAITEVFAALSINPGYAHAWEDLDNLRNAKGMEPLDHLELWDASPVSGPVSTSFEQDLATNERLAKSHATSPSLIRLKALQQRGLLKETTFILAPKAHHWPAWATFRQTHPDALRRFVEGQQLRPSEEMVRSAHR